MFTLVLFVYPVVFVVAALAVGPMSDCLIIGIVPFEYPIHLLEQHYVVLVDLRLPFLLQLHALGVSLTQPHILRIGLNFFGLLRVCRCYPDGDEIFVMFLHVVMVYLIHDKFVKDWYLPIHTVIM